MFFSSVADGAPTYHSVGAQGACARAGRASVGGHAHPGARRVRAGAGASAQAGAQAAAVRAAASHPSGAVQGAPRRDRLPLLRCYGDRVGEISNEKRDFLRRDLARLFRRDFASLLRRACTFGTFTEVLLRRSCDDGRLSLCSARRAPPTSHGTPPRSLHCRYTAVTLAVTWHTTSIGLLPKPPLHFRHCRY